MSAILKTLRSSNFNLTKKCATTATTATVLFNFLISSNINTVTINKPLITRNFHHFSTTNLNSCREKQQQQQQSTAVKLVSTLNSIKDEYKTRSLSSFHKYKDVMDAPPGVLKGSLDRFNGVTIYSDKEFNANDNFAEKLSKSLAHWKEQKRRAIWFYVKKEHSEWVPYLTKMGFEFHHAKTGIVILNRWLPEDEYPNCPVYAHTMLGVGGLVVNENNEVLVVSERFPLIPNSWKLPGGYVEPKENIIDAAIREVREETGIDSTFNTVVSLRHSHNGVFGCSDIYCVVALTPTSLELHRCEREIAKTKWMPCEEYLQHPNVHETNRHFLACFLDYKKRGITFTCEMAEHQVLKKKYCIYYMKPVQDEDNRHAKGVCKV